MSYARWSNSCWYAFDNVGGCLSLWYDFEQTIDWKLEDCKNLTVDKIMEIYGCTEIEAEEAMEYVAKYISENSITF
jgi:hypothetical protein